VTIILLESIFGLVKFRLWRKHRVHDQRLDFNTLIIFHVLHFLNGCLLALISGILDTAYFFAIKPIPSEPMILEIEFSSVNWVDEIDKSISETTPIILIERIVEEVIMIWLIAIDWLKEHVYGIFVRNIADHHCSSGVSPIEHIRSINNEAAIRFVEF